MLMPFEWDVGVSSKEHHGDRAHVHQTQPATGLHHLKGHYSIISCSQRILLPDEITNLLEIGLVRQPRDCHAPKLSLAER